MRKYTVTALVLSLCLGFSIGYLTPNSWAAETVTDVEKAEPNLHRLEPNLHRLVIQVNKKDEELQDHILSNIVNLQKHFGMDNIEIEVVAYGPGIWFLTDKSPHKQRIESLLLQNVVFTACGNTLDTVEAKEGKRPTLIDDVEIAQAGIARIMERQDQGWNYLSP